MLLIDDIIKSCSSIARIGKKNQYKNSGSCFGSMWLIILIILLSTKELYKCSLLILPKYSDIFI